MKPVLGENTCGKYVIGACGIGCEGRCQFGFSPRECRGFDLILAAIAYRRSYDLMQIMLGAVMTGAGWDKKSWLYCSQPSDLSMYAESELALNVGTSVLRSAHFFVTRIPELQCRCMLCD